MLGMYHSVIQAINALNDLEKSIAAQSPLHIMLDPDPDPDAQQWHDRDKAARNRREPRRRSDTPPRPLTFHPARKPATKCPHSFTIFSRNRIFTTFYRKNIGKTRKVWFFLILFDFLSQEIKWKKLEKTCNLSVLFDISWNRLYPPFDFQMIYARVCNRWKATRESLEPPPTTADSQTERDGCSGTRKGKAIFFYRWEHLQRYFFLLAAT